MEGILARKMIDSKHQTALEDADSLQLFDFGLKALTDADKLF